jgi:hypothetical protein
LVAAPPADWKALRFEDSSWSQAAMPLVGEARQGAAAVPPAQRIPARAETAYVRLHFHVGPEGASLRSLLLRARFSEGLIAWIDGIEVARRYVAEGAKPEDPSEQIHGPESEDFPIPLLGARGALRAPGEHVLALEIHAHAPGLGPSVEAALSGFDAIRVIRGPYLVRPSEREITVVWETDLDAPGAVQYGMTPDRGKTLATPLPVRHHALRIRGLRPRTTYHYRVLAGGMSVDGGVFHTLPPPGAPLRVAIYGDMRNGHDIHAQIVERIRREAPDLVALTGDLVDRGSEEADWQRFFQIAGPMLRTVPIVPALGNHDIVRFEGFRRFVELFPVPPGAPEPGYYAFDAAGVHFTVLDSNHLRSAQQLAWCDADLEKAQRARARIVMMHHGPWSVGLHGGNTDAARLYAPIFSRRNVTLLLAGHDHSYERGSVDGIDYVVSGGGGAHLYPMRCGGIKEKCPRTTLFAASEYHYILLEVRDDTYRLCTKRIDGTPLEPCLDRPLRRAHP